VHEHGQHDRERLTEGVSEEPMRDKTVCCGKPGGTGLLGNEFPDPNENVDGEQQVVDERKSPGWVLVTNRNEHWREPSTGPSGQPRPCCIAWPVRAGMVHRTLMKPRILRSICRIVGLCSLAQAGGCTSSSWDGHVFRGENVEFRAAQVPAGWRRIEDERSLLTFRDARRDLVVTVNGRCGKDGDDVPLQALTQHLFVYFTERQVLDQRTITLDGREALRTELSAKLDGVARHFVVYVMKKNGCVYDFIQIAALNVDANCKAEFDQFVLSFSTQSGESRDPQLQVK